MVLINYQIINDLIKLLSFYQAQDVLEILYVIKYSELYPLLSPIVIQLVHQLVNVYFAEDILEVLNQIYEPEIEIFANYVYLDHAERQAFATTPHEFLINQFHHTI